MKVLMAAVVFFCAMVIADNSAISQTWTQTAATTNMWSSIACSADGMKLFVCAGSGGGTLFSGNPSPIYASTNGGSTWAQTGAPSNYWASIASSADGTKLVAVVGTSSRSGGIFTSTDGGLNWTSNNVTAKPWRSVASSADGSKLVGVTFSGQLYATTDSGTTWISNAAPNGAWAIACSADGTKLAAVPGNFGGYICTSTNSGASWTTNNSSPSRMWSSVASSSDGNVLAAVDGTGSPFGHIFISTNSGVTWFSNNVPLLSWQNIAVSADGTKLIAAGWFSSGIPTGPIYTSTDSGVTWVSNNVPNLIWNGVACSADGTKLMAISAGTNVSSIGQGSVWISQTTASPILNIALVKGLQLSWLIPSTNFVLQQSADMASWAYVTNLPVLDLKKLQNQVTLPSSGNTGFYRLKIP
jgi:photosystem II stability/assembly factor-like uncharacterized protein